MTDMKRFWPWVLRVIVSLALVAAGWYAFLWLVADRAVGENPALVMVWASVIALLLVMFPDVIKRVRRVRFGDFELELHGEIDKAVRSPPIIADADRNTWLASKAGPEELTRIFRVAASDRSRPIVLDVDLGRGERISIIALHLYLTFLVFVQNPVIVIFRSAEVDGAGERSRLRGIIDGTRLWRLLRREFPRAWETIRVLHNPELIRQVTEGSVSPDGPNLYPWWDDLRGVVQEARLDQKWFNRHIVPELSRNWLSLEVEQVPLTRVQEALRQEDVDWLLLLRDGDVVGILNLCRVGRRIAAERAEQRSA